MSSATQTPERIYGDIPPNLDPISAGVELSYLEGNTKRSLVLQRSRDDKQQLPCSIASEDVVHLFADNKLISRSTIVLGYSRTGVLVTGFDRAINHAWYEMNVSEEMNGATVTRHSVRIVFDKEEDARSLHALIDSCLRSKQVSSLPFLAETLKKAKVAYLVPIAGT